MSRRPDGRLTAAGVLAALALGLPWGPATAGTAAPARVAIAAAVVLVAVGLARGRHQLVRWALPAGAVGVLLGGLTPSPGRLALAGAVACLAAALRTDRRRVPAAR